jgi:hypothetical protein
MHRLAFCGIKGVASLPRRFEPCPKNTEKIGPSGESNGAFTEGIFLDKVF